MKPKFDIGYEFKRHSINHANIEKIIDIYYVRNNRGALIRFYYVTARDVLGQIVIDYEVPESIIARSV